MFQVLGSGFKCQYLVKQMRQGASERDVAPLDVCTLQRLVLTVQMAST